jgi:hypothetical protein
MLQAWAIFLILNAYHVKPLITNLRVTRFILFIIRRLPLFHIMLTYRKVLKGATNLHGRAYLSTNNKITLMGSTVKRVTKKGIKDSKKDCCCLSHLSVDNFLRLSHVKEDVDVNQRGLELNNAQAYPRIREYWAVYTLCTMGFTLVDSTVQ